MKAGSVVLSDPAAGYRAVRSRSFFLALLLGTAIAALIIFTIGLGAMKIPARDIVRVFAARFLGNEALLEGQPRGLAAVVWELRFPRILCGVLAGAGLAVAGVIFQAILENPLADPYTLGISSGAAFGASLAIFFNLSAGLFISTSFFALIFASLTLGAVILIAERGNSLAGANLIMAGIIVSAILQAGISFLKMLSGENVGAIVFWLMGSLSAKSWKETALLAAVVPAATITAALFAGNLNALSLGSREAGALGVEVKRTRFLYLLLGSGISAVCVSVCGIIGFVGLIVPHLLRFSVTSDNRLLIPLSALAGGFLLVLADTCARLLGSGEIPVGVLTTLLGGPFFISIFIRRNGAQEL
jgi:iron complex transport system permease protein